MSCPLPEKGYCKDQRVMAQELPELSVPRVIDRKGFVFGTDISQRAASNKYSGTYDLGFQFSRIAQKRS